MASRCLIRGKLGHHLIDWLPIVHDLLLKKAIGEFDPKVWNEQTSGIDHIVVIFSISHAPLEPHNAEQGGPLVALLRDADGTELSLFDQVMIIAMPD